ncbi:MAG: hypothetical protein KF887_14145 [Paracoccaceae bacterium]|nr:MAG: hypothetical protein KF887_14145 [Paracoccaceae bacterium]
MRAVVAVLTLAALAACSTPVPDSGVGFGDYSAYLRERERALASGQPVATPPATVPGTPAPGGFDPAAIGSAIDRADGRTVAPGPSAPAPAAGALIGAEAARPRGDAPATIRPEGGEVRQSTGISDEQDFAAVSARETIESDAERIARARAQYQVVQPTALPTRTGSAGPNIVSFALSTTHAPGTPMYRRSAFGSRDPFANCGKFASPDLAQEAFLSAGGPERDPQRLDPDGDGFVCGWDPRPFRAAKR